MTIKSEQLQHEKDPVVDSMPKDWLPEQQQIAKEAVTVLLRHYPGWVWQIEWTAIVGKGSSAMIIRLGDVPTNITYIIQYEDIDRDQLKVVMRAGGEFLEALGLSRTKNRHDEVRGLKTTPAGLIVPDYAAMPETNPGYEKVKTEYNKLN